MEGSFQTPLGNHRICERIGDGMPLMAVFRGRQPIGIYDVSTNHLTSLPWMAGKRDNVCEPCETRTFRMAYKQKSWKIFALQQSDWILTRILWLEGIEPGKNSRGRVDTKSRYIYIHGTHDEASIGRPVSHGCIRMNNLDMLEVFKHAFPGERVRITEKQTTRSPAEA